MMGLSRHKPTVIQRVYVYALTISVFSFNDFVGIYTFSGPTFRTPNPYFLYNFTLKIKYI